MYAQRAIGEEMQCAYDANTYFIRIYILFFDRSLHVQNAFATSQYRVTLK